MTAVLTDELRAAIAERMNRLDEVRWDRCVVRKSGAVVYGWIARDDGRSDFVVLEFAWGVTEGLDGATVPWLGVGFTTSSVIYSAEISKRLHGTVGATHSECERVESVFGDLVDQKVVLGASG